MHKKNCVALATLAAAFTACSGPPPAAPAPAPQAAVRDAWPDFASAFIEATLKADPYFAVNAGRHEFDGQMADWSGASLAA